MVPVFTTCPPVLLSTTPTHTCLHSPTFNLEVVEWLRIDSSNGTLLVSSEGPLLRITKNLGRQFLINTPVNKHTTHKQK